MRTASEYAALTDEALAQVAQRRTKAALEQIRLIELDIQVELRKPLPGYKISCSDNLYRETINILRERGFTVTWDSLEWISTAGRYPMKQVVNFFVVSWGPGTNPLRQDPVLTAVKAAWQQAVEVAGPAHGGTEEAQAVMSAAMDAAIAQFNQR